MEKWLQDLYNALAFAGEVNLCSANFLTICLFLNVSDPSRFCDFFSFSLFFSPRVIICAGGTQSPGSYSTSTFPGAPGPAKSISGS